MCTIEHCTILADWYVVQYYVHHNEQHANPGMYHHHLVCTTSASWSVLKPLLCNWIGQKESGGYIFHLELWLTKKHTS